MRSRVAMTLLVSGFLASGRTAAADAFTYTNGVFTTIDVPGSSGTLAWGINDSGQVVGSFYDGSGHLHGFVDTNGSFATITFPGTEDTSAMGINDAGAIVGFYRNSAGVGSPFLDVNGIFTSLHGVSATDINSSGQIVGYSSAVDSFLYSNGLYTTIDVPGAAFTTAWGINGAAQIVGGYGDGTGGEHGFVKTGTSFVRFDAPGSGSGRLAYTVAFGINDSGQIVGIAGSQGFLDSEGLFSTIDFPGATSTILTGINDSGEIIGNYTPPTSVPEPSYFLPLALTLMVLGGSAVKLRTRQSVRQSHR